LSSSITGVATFRGGGGGGGGFGGNSAAGGNGGGGGINSATGSGTANTGGGGVGDSTSTYTNNGGSGVVIIAYPDSYSIASATTGTPTYSSVSRSGYHVYTFTASGSITF
jgi:hypothetical protein